MWNNILQIFYWLRTNQQEQIYEYIFFPQFSYAHLFLEFL